MFQSSKMMFVAILFYLTVACLWYSDGFKVNDLVRPRGGGVSTQRKSNPADDDRSFQFSKENLLATFNNIRIPAAVLSGASFAAVQGASMPVSADSVIAGTVKRIYLLVAVGSFVSSLISIMTSTVAIEILNGYEVTQPKDLEFHYTCVLTNFLFTLIGSCMLVGLRAWISFSCLTFGNIALSTVATCIFFMLSMLPKNILHLPLKYIQLIGKSLSLNNPLLLVSVSLLIPRKICHHNLIYDYII